MVDQSARTNIRSLDAELWKAVKLEAMRQDKAAGALLNEIIRQWLDQQNGRK